MMKNRDLNSMKNKINSMKIKINEKDMNNLWG